MRILMAMVNCASKVLQYLSFRLFVSHPRWATPRPGWSLPTRLSLDGPTSSGHWRVSTGLWSSHHNTRASLASLASLLAMAYCVGETGRARDHHQRSLVITPERASEMFRQSYMIHYDQHMS